MNKPMQETTKKTTRIFTYEKGDNGRELLIVDGQIRDISIWSHGSGGSIDKNDTNFINSCFFTIRLIVDQNLKSLKEIYNALSDGPAKDFCRKLQKEKLEDLNF